MIMWFNFLERKDRWIILVFFALAIVKNMFFRSWICQRSLRLLSKGNGQILKMSLSGRPLVGRLIGLLICFNIVAFTIILTLLSVQFILNNCVNKGVQLKLVREGRNILSCAREASAKFFPPLGMIFAPSGHPFPPFLLN